MSFFSWKKVRVETAEEVGLSDEKKAQIDAVVASWGEVSRSGRKSTYDASEAPMQIVTAEEVAYFVHAMEAEAARLDAAATELQKRRLAEIAERDAQIASINREIEAMKAKARTEDDEIHRRAEARAKLLAVVAKIDPSLDASKITKDADIRREVVRRRFGDEAVNGRSDAYIDERFESLEARVNVDPFAAVVKDGLKPSDGDLRGASERAYQQMVADLNNWRH
ncbi:hypothetical protein [Shinella sp. JR1-6]|uniref:hypothetical protein n=1 Tax=Shinella sp. JR1-6 TaxID=2527671 RepID=UPI00102D3B4D|nr:hypothetical protein [Shinella sp. JR1-6]TAA61877.1 hypothetical protein EXZ48_12195 [Shinella sp. JR1-6]